MILISEWSMGDSGAAAASFVPPARPAHHRRPGIDRPVAVEFASWRRRRRSTAGSLPAGRPPSPGS